MALPRSLWRRWRGALRFPNGGSCFSPWRRCVMLRVSHRVPLCVPPPRPICLCVGPSLCSGYFRFAPIGSSLKLPLLVPSGAGRGLKVCSSCRRCVLRASNGFPARSGATRAAKPPKTERGAFPTKRACRESAALGFPPPAGVAPSIGTLPLRGEAGRKPREGGGRFCEVGTTPRTTNRPRGRRLSASLFSRLCWSLRGR